MVYTNECLDLAVEDTEAIPHPRKYNLPHDAWRPYQYETVQWIEGNSGIMICEQPTGCHTAGTMILMHCGLSKPVEKVEIGE